MSLGQCKSDQKRMNLVDLKKSCKICLWSSWENRLRYCRERTFQSFDSQVTRRLPGSKNINAGRFHYVVSRLRRSAYLNMANEKFALIRITSRLNVHKQLFFPAECSKWKINKNLFAAETFFQTVQKPSTATGCARYLQGGSFHMFARFFWETASRRK